MFSMYDEDLNRMRDTATGRFVKFAHAYGEPDETCPNCCDLHNRNCEPPSELCCFDCTEAVHPDHWRDGSDCIAPDLTRVIPRGEFA